MYSVTPFIWHSLESKFMGMENRPMVARVRGGDLDSWERDSIGNLGEVESVLYPGQIMAVHMQI